MIGDTDLRIAKLYGMLPASATGDGSDLMSNAESTRRLHPVVVRAELYWPTQHGEERGQRLQALLE